MKKSGLRMTDEQLSGYVNRMAKSANTQFKTAKTANSGLDGMRALGRLKAGQMNKTELAYEAHLFARKAAGEIAWYKFEGVKLRLADNTFYSPDFAVMLASGEMQIHEVKGFWQDDARVKIKVAAELYPFQFIAVKKGKAGWEFENF
jgi:hypothetical protein